MSDKLEAKTEKVIRAAKAWCHDFAFTAVRDCMTPTALRMMVRFERDRRSRAYSDFLDAKGEFPYGALRAIDKEAADVLTRYGFTLPLLEPLTIQLDSYEDRDERIKEQKQFDEQQEKDMATLLACLKRIFLFFIVWAVLVAIYYNTPPADGPHYAATVFGLTIVTATLWLIVPRVCD